MELPASPSSDRIFNKALELFSSRGYHATSVREICAAAGVTKPTLYHFYGSKEGVYRALVDGTLEDFRAKLLRHIESAGSVRERLRQVARGYFEYARGRRELVRFILGLIHDPPSSAPVTDFRRFYESIVALIARLVEEGVAEGSLAPGPTGVRLLVFLGALGEALHGYVIVGQPDLTPELADTLADTIVDGWAAKPMGP